MAESAGELLAEVARAPRRRRLGRVGEGLVRQPAAILAGIVLVLVFLAGLIVPSLFPHRGDLDLSNVEHPPTFSGWHLFGTNNIGQDVFFRSIQALHATEQTAVVGTLVATVLGVVIGAIAGYRGGWMDAALMRIADVLGIPPAVLVLLVLYSYFRPVTPMRAALLLACLLWIPVARVVRAGTVSLRNREFVEAAISIGATDRRIFFRHLVPNLGSTIIVSATTLFGQLIMIEAMVEFFGLGDSEGSQPTLGGLIGDGKLSENVSTSTGWWAWAGPALILVIVLVCANLLGDAVAEALRPRARR